MNGLSWAKGSGVTPNSYYSLGAVVSFSLSSQRPLYFCPAAPENKPLIGLWARQTRLNCGMAQSDVKWC